MGVLSLWHWVVAVFVAMVVIAPARLVKNAREAGKLTKQLKDE